MDTSSIITQVSRNDEQLNTFPPSENGKCYGCKWSNMANVNVHALQNIVRCVTPRKSICLCVTVKNYGRFLHWQGTLNIFSFVKYNKTCSCLFLRVKAMTEFVPGRGEG